MTKLQPPTRILQIIATLPQKLTSFPSRLNTTNHSSKRLISSFRTKPIFLSCSTWIISIVPRVTPPPFLPINPFPLPFPTQMTLSPCPPHFVRPYPMPLPPPRLPCRTRRIHLLPRIYRPFYPITSILLNRFINAHTPNVPRVTAPVNSPNFSQFFYEIARFWKVEMRRVSLCQALPRVSPKPPRAMLPNGY